MYNIAPSRSEALKLLSIAYPNGAKKLMAAKREELRVNRDPSGEKNREESMSIAKEMAQEMMAKREYLLDYAKSHI